MRWIIVTLGFSWSRKSKRHTDDAIHVSQTDTRVWLNLLQTQFKSGVDASASLNNKPTSSHLQICSETFALDVLKSSSLPISLQCFWHKTGKTVTWHVSVNGYLGSGRTLCCGAFVGGRCSKSASFSDWRLLFKISSACAPASCLRWHVSVWSPVVLLMSPPPSTQADGKQCVTPSS